MSEEHAYGHTITDLIIEFENVTKEELWELYKLTKKKLDKETADHKETILAYDVLSDEFKQMESDLKEEIQEMTKSEEFAKAVKSHYGDYEPPSQEGLWVKKGEHDRVVDLLKGRVLFFDKKCEDLKKRLEELEDAISNCFEVYPPDPDSYRSIPHIYPRPGRGDEIFQAIQNSRERQEENRLRKKVGEFIDRNGGEAMG